LDLLQIGSDPFNRMASRLTTVTEIKHESGIAYCFTSEASRTEISDAQEFFDITQ